MRTIETKLYKFDELSEKAKEKAIEKLWDINVSHEWWEFSFEDAKNIGVTIKEFDIDRASYCKMEFNDTPGEVARAIIKDHGDTCDTYKLAKEFLSDWAKLVEKHSDGINKELVTEENENEFDSAANDLEEEFKRALSEEYLSILRKEYEYLTSEEVIIESIRANEYEFTENGELN